MHLIAAFCKGFGKAEVNMNDIWYGAEYLTNWVGIQRYQNQLVAILA